MGNIRLRMELTEREQALLSMLRALGYGEILVKVDHGIPTEIEELRRSVMLDH